MWTLEYNGQEKSFSGWGLSLQGATMRRVNMAPDVLSVGAPGPYDAALAIPYRGAVIVRRDREGDDQNGYSEGSIFFQGKAGKPLRNGNGQGEGIVYRFFGPWADFERVTFQQVWNEFSGYATPGDPNSDPVYVQLHSSEVFMGQTITGQPQTTGAQITEAVDWAITCGVSVQLGTVDPATNIMVYNSRDIMVSEVIQQMLRWTPDCVCWFDYSTTPPTFNCRRAANLVDVALNLVNTPPCDLQLEPCYDLQLPAVSIKFRWVNEVDGRPSVVYSEQRYPAEATGYEIGAAVFTVELSGYSRTNVYSVIASTAVAAQDATAATRWAWWDCKDPVLSSACVNTATATVSVATIKDDSGNDVSLGDYPYELVDGSIASWMKVNGAPATVKEVTIKALATYDLYREANGWTKTNASNLLVEKARSKELSVRVRLTNAPSGTYSVLGSYSSAEPEPAGLAKDIYDAHAQLRYEGAVTLVGEEVPATIGMGNTVTISTGTANYATQLVQSITEDIGTGKLTVQIGPASHLGISDLIELTRVNRYRLVINNPLSRTTGDASATGAVTLGKNVPRENTSGGNGLATEYAVSGVVAQNKTGVARMSAASKKLIIEVQNSDTQSGNYGLPITTEGRVEISLADCAGKELKVREWDVCVEVDGEMVSKKALFLSTAAYAAS